MCSGRSPSLHRKSNDIEIKDISDFKAYRVENALNF
jgi:hypothetical protein